MRPLLKYALVLIVAQCLIAGIASAEPIVIPDSWVGVWETTTTEFNCLTPENQTVSTSVDTFCAGDTIEPDDPDGTFPDWTCDGTINDTVLHMECSGSQEVLPGCIFTISFVSDATRSGNTSTGVNVMTTTFEGDCPISGDCTQRESVSVRTSEDPGCGSAPVALSNWGTMKSYYR